MGGMKTTFFTGISVIACMLRFFSIVSAQDLPVNGPTWERLTYFFTAWLFQGNFSTPGFSIGLTKSLTESCLRVEKHYNHVFRL